MGLYNDVIVEVACRSRGHTAQRDRTPAVAWHPEKPILVMASMGGGFVQWNPVGIREFEGLPPTASYRSLAFSPNGQTLWASPSWVDGHTS